MDNDCRVLVIIPAYNESENIEQVIGRITEYQAKANLGVLKRPCV